MAVSIVLKHSRPVPGSAIEKAFQVVLTQEDLHTAWKLSKTGEEGLCLRKARDSNWLIGANSIDGTMAHQNADCPSPRYIVARPKGLCAPQVTFWRYSPRRKGRPRLPATDTNAARDSQSES